MRLLMDDHESDAAEKMFRAGLYERFPRETDVPARVQEAWDFASQIDYRHGDLPSWTYLNHILRVASIIAKDVPDATIETFTIAFLHNVLEVSSVSPGEIETRFGLGVSSAIQALTIDRNRKDKSYLEEYYSRIEATSASCAEVKVVDKLDNIYMICFNPSPEVRSSYLEEIDEWVVPLALRIVPGIGIRMKGVSMVMRRLGFLERKKEIGKIGEEAGK